MDHDPRRELERKLDSEIMSEDRQIDRPYVVTCDRETIAPHFFGQSKAVSFLPGTLDTGHGTLSSSLSTAGKTPHALQA